MAVNMNKIICAIFLLLGGKCMAQDKFTIAGTLPNVGPDKMVILSYVNSEGKNKNDTALVKNGKFTLSATTAYGNKAYLSLKPVQQDTARRRVATDSREFYLEKGTYKVEGVDSMNTAKITGPRAQKDFLEYSLEMNGLIKQWRDISARFSKVYYAKEKDTVLIKAIQAEARPVHAKIEETLDAFIFGHPDSYVTVDLVYSEKTAVIDSTFDRYYVALSPRVLNSFTGQKITEKYMKARQVSIGKTFDFTQPDTAGKAFTLSTLRGKYVLVDFWASWCAPCRAENPNLLKAYQQLRADNFEIVGISVDENKVAWLRAVKFDRMPWVQVSDLKGFKNAVALKYGITAVPQNLLINPQGVIIARNLRGEGLTDKLTALMK